MVFALTLYLLFTEFHLQVPKPVVPQDAAQQNTSTIRKELKKKLICLALSVASLAKRCRPGTELLTGRSASQSF